MDDLLSLDAAQGLAEDSVGDLRRLFSDLVEDFTALDPHELKARF